MGVNFDVKRATLVISIYKNVRSLSCILSSLKFQTYTEFDLIVSEDGESREVADFLSSTDLSGLCLTHLTQKDIGFRKTRALNRAIIASKNDYLIFIDGDCVPHVRFIEAHLKNAVRGRFGAGRRVELGRRCSEILLDNPAQILRWSTTQGFLRDYLMIYADGARHPEAALRSKLLSILINKRQRPIVGCNFSCFKQDLERVNGFNEEFQEVGTGEDTDIEWRLRASGCTSIDLKHKAPLFHIFHERQGSTSITNGAILEASKARGQWFCQFGLGLHSSRMVDESRTAKLNK